MVVAGGGYDNALTAQLFNQRRIFPFGVYDENIVRCVIERIEGNFILCKERLAAAGADIIGVHYEATPHIHRALKMIHETGKKAELVICPGTSVAMITDLLSEVDQVLVMTVDPGFGGQHFLPSMTHKIKQLAEIKAQRGFAFEIEVDGGINDQTIEQCKQAGATIAVAGSFVYNHETPAIQIQKLKAV